MLGSKLHEIEDFKKKTVRYSYWPKNIWVTFNGEQWVDKEGGLWSGDVGAFFDEPWWYEEPKIVGTKETIKLRFYRYTYRATSPVTGITYYVKSPWVTDRTFEEKYETVVSIEIKDEEITI